MGLFDNLDEDKKAALSQGLLSAGLATLANNRGINAGIGAIGLGGLQGVNAYQEAMARPLQRQLLEAQASKAQSEAEQQQFATQMAKKRMDFFSGSDSTSSDSGYSPPGEEKTTPNSYAASAPSGQMDKMSTTRTKAMSYLNLSDKLLAAGLPEDAATYAKLGKELLPSLSKTEVVTDPQTGDRILTNFYSDGSVEKVPYNPDQEKLMETDEGGTKTLRDPRTGKPIVSVRKTPSPDAVMSNATTRLGQRIGAANDSTRIYDETGNMPPYPPGVLPSGGAQQSIPSAPPMMQQAPQVMPGQPSIVPGIPQQLPGRSPLQAAGPAGGPIGPRPAIVTPQPNIQNPNGLPNKANREIRIAGLKETAQKDAKYVDDLRTKAQNYSQTVLPSLERLKATVNDGVYSGPLAERQANAANWLKQVFGADIDSKLLENSQIFEKDAGTLGNNIAKAVFGSRITNADLASVQRLIPQLTQSPKARMELINQYEQSANKAINLYNAAQDHYNKNGNLSTFDVTKSPSPYKPLKPYTDADIAETARQTGMTVDQVKKMLKDKGL